MNNKQLAKKAFILGKRLAIYRITREIESILRNKIENIELSDFDYNILVGNSKFKEG